MITAAQCRAARGLLDWSQLDLAKFAGVGVVTVHQLEAAGVEFIEKNGGGEGVRLKKPSA
jgi:DNA-binding XRE family transcriptional regulator